MSPARPNLLFVFADQMRARDMGCAGNADVPTPSLDRLAAEGIRFRHAVSCMPVCTPHRACLLTGRYPQTTGMFLNDLQMSTRETTIAHVLAAAGYATAYVGKWHLDGSRRWAWTPPGRRRQGFQYWHAVNCDHRDYLDPIYYEDEDRPLRPRQYCTDHETGVALRYLDRFDRRRPDCDRRPFCLFLSWSPPHNPYHQLPPRWRDRIDPRSLRLPANTEDTPEHRRDLAGYYAHIGALDDNLGWILGGLEERGLAEDTLLVFTSDHGDMLGAQGRYRKQWPWDESVLVPLILRWPAGFGSGAVCDILFNSADYMPTLLHWLAVDPPTGLEGTDLAGAIDGAQAGPPSAFLQIMAPFSEQTTDPWRGVRTHRHTYARRREGPWLLYDNRQDPEQLHNLVNEPAAAPDRQALDAELAQWMARLGDTFDAPATYLARHGYQVDERGGHIPYTYQLPAADWPVQVATRADEAEG
ncbi:MAG: sulfatase [Gemmatimonadota bacterium]